MTRRLHYLDRLKTCSSSSRYVGVSEIKESEIFNTCIISDLIEYFPDVSDRLIVVGKDTAIF